MTTYPPYVGDVGYPVTLPVGNYKGTTGLTKQEIHITRPDGTTATWTASVVDDNNITYDTLAADFSVKGDYKLQPYGEYTGGEKLYGPVTLLHVYDVGELPAGTMTSAVSGSSDLSVYSKLKNYADDTFLTIDGDVTHEQLVDMIIVGDAPPTVTPTFIGQVFIDKTNKKSYHAYGTSSAADWGALN